MLEISKKQLADIDMAAAGSNSKLEQLKTSEKNDIKKRSLDLAKNVARGYSNI